MRYEPRNDFVLLRLEQQDTTEAGVVLPHVGDEGKVWTVEAVGPDVKDLKPDDIVMLVGTIGEDIAALPRVKGRYVTKQVNILLIVRE